MIEAARLLEFLITVAAWVFGVRAEQAAGRPPQPEGRPVAVAAPDRRKALVLGIIGFLVTSGGLLGSAAVLGREPNAGFDAATFLLLLAPMVLAGFVVGLLGQSAAVTGGITAWAIIFGSVNLLYLTAIPPFDPDPQGFWFILVPFLAMLAAGVLVIAGLIARSVAQLRR